MIEKESDVVFYLLSLPLTNFQTPHIVNSCLNRLLEIINNSSGSNKLKKITTMKEVWIPGLYYISITFSIDDFISLLTLYLVFVLIEKIVFLPLSKHLKFH